MFAKLFNFNIFRDRATFVTHVAGPAIRNLKGADGQPADGPEAGFGA
jgi:hypothetical protein